MNKEQSEKICNRVLEIFVYNKNSMANFSVYNKYENSSIIKNHISKKKMHHRDKLQKSTRKIGFLPFLK